MPSLADLQSSIGDLGFEVIVVNHTMDATLVELEQIAQCCMLDCPATETALLVQRIAELVIDNMGGPVKDANDMLARWMVCSTELRTSLQTSLLPIGCIKIGLLRHRALLFKVYYVAFIAILIFFLNSLVEATRMFALIAKCTTINPNLIAVLWWERWNRGVNNALHNSIFYRCPYLWFTPKTADISR